MAQHNHAVVTLQSDECEGALIRHLHSPRKARLLFVERQLRFDGTDDENGRKVADHGRNLSQRFRNGLEKFAIFDQAMPKCPDRRGLVRPTL